jgi:ADP-heptose:LPS heptosyltransferase
MKTLLPYHRRNPLAITKLIIVDLYYWFYANLFRRNIALPKNLNHVLLVNPAHLGDVVISTAILRELKSAIPSCKVDFLVGDWAAPVVKEHPGVHQTFYISHWHANRSEDSLLKKQQKYEQQVKKVISQLKAVSYDAIFFLNSYEPSFISLFKDFGCPLIGLISAGGGPLLSFKGDGSAVHEVKIQASLFTPWINNLKGAGQYRPWLKTFTISEQLKKELGLTKPYVVLHPGSGNPAKEWPIENWVQVMCALAKYKVDIVITGHGEREKNQANVLVNDRSMNLVDKLHFDQFIGVLEGAQAVLCVDSVAGHIAAAYDKTVLMVGNGLSKIERWHPLGERIVLLEKRMPCSPCHSNPCAQRTCVTSISPKMLVDQLPKILGK